MARPDAFSDDCAGNKAIILERLTKAGCHLQRVIAEEEAPAGNNDGHSPKFCELKQKSQHQLDSFLKMAEQMRNTEFSKEGSRALLVIIDHWRTDAAVHLQTWLAEKGYET